jgi:replicative DNA helicase
MLSMNSKVDSQKIRTGNLEDEDWGKLVDSVRRLGNSNLVIDDSSGITASEIHSKCRRARPLCDFLDIVSFIPTSSRRFLIFPVH